MSLFEINILSFIWLWFHALISILQPFEKKLQKKFCSDHFLAKYSPVRFTGQKPCHSQKPVFEK